MNAQLRYAVFNTPFGWVGILASGKGLVSLTFPQPSEREAFMGLGDRAIRAIRSLEFFPDLISRLKAYCKGSAATFPDRLDLSEATPFQQAVWEETRLIPYGETRTYGWVAKQVGRPATARAVGQALGKNPLPIIIPCHRVVASDGGLGGFSGGLKMKERLLGLEQGIEHRA